MSPWTVGASEIRSATRFLGFNDDMGSWKIIWIFKNVCARVMESMSNIGCPQNLRCPALAGKIPASIRPSVDFPHPLSPTTPSTSPVFNVSETSQSACRLRGLGWRKTDRTIFPVKSSCAVKVLEIWTASRIESVMHQSPAGDGTLQNVWL